MALLCEAVRAQQLTLDMVEALADDLLVTEYYLPFAPGEFRMWALREGLLEYNQP